MIDLIVHPLGDGDYRVEADGRVLCERTAEPLLAGARALVCEGRGPGTRVSLSHAVKPDVSLVATIGEAAKLAVREDQRTGPGFFQRWEASGG